jgi:hypothetical protein
MLEPLHKFLCRLTFFYEPLHKCLCRLAFFFKRHKYLCSGSSISAAAHRKRSSGTEICAAAQALVERLIENDQAAQAFVQRCHEPPGAFSNCQPAGQHGSISSSGPLLPRPCLCLGHLHLGLGLRPRCWYILVLAYTLAYSITNDHSLRTATHRSHDQRPSLRQTPRAPALRHHLEQHSMVLR